MEVRRAQRKDIPRLIQLGGEFALKSQPIHGFNISDIEIIHFVNEIVDHSLGIVLVLEENGIVQGVIAGVIQKIFFSQDIALQELVWYVKEGFRGITLFSAFEQEAKQKGCHHIIVGNKPAYCDLQKFYERQGYRMLENQYVKSLGSDICQFLQPSHLPQV